MSTLSRFDVSGGWMPNADAAGCPANGFLRADNLTLDSDGALTLRPGSVKLSATPFSDLDVHSLATFVLSGTRYRLAGAGSTIYSNGASLITSVAGSGDVAFGSHQGQMLIARSTTKKKYDGTTVRNWGISMTGSAPTAAVLAADGKSFADCSHSESPGFVTNEGVALFVNGLDDVDAGAVRVFADHGMPLHGNYTCADELLLTPMDWGQFNYTFADEKDMLTPDARVGPGVATSPGDIYWQWLDAVGGDTTHGPVTNRGTITKTFASPTDFTTYDGGATGLDADLFQFWVYLDNPDLLTRISILVDVNASAAKPFSEDYYLFKFQPNQILTTDVEDPLGEDFFSVEADQRERVIRRAGPIDKPKSTTVTTINPISKFWNKITVRRGQFERIGSTSGKGWNTVKAIRFVVEMAQPESHDENFDPTGIDNIASLIIDNVSFVGGNTRPLTGRYAYRYVYVRNNGTYNALSAPSSISSPIYFAGQGGDLTIPADASRDSQVNEIWLFRMGEALDAWYRVTVKTGVSGTGSVSISDVTSDVSALITNVRIDLKIVTPPDGIIGIAGPFKDRTFCLTTTALKPSKRLNPDSFSTGEEINVGDGTETPYWVRKSSQSILVGTSKDIYVLDGTGGELADGTLDFAFRPLGIDHPPISAAIAQEGDGLVYLAADGWRQLGGVTSTLLTGQTSLLYRGQTRHGVPPINLTSGRFRAALTHGALTVLAPEGDRTSATEVVYRLKGGQWARAIYPEAFQTFHVEPDGTLIASGKNGTIWALDSGGQDDSAFIPIELWTRRDDDGRPFQRKLVQALRAVLDTGGATATIAVHPDGDDVADTSVTLSTSGPGAAVASLTDDVTPAKALQLRVTGAFATFSWAGHGLDYTDLPPLFRGRLASTNVGKVQQKTICGYVIRCCTLGPTRTFTPYLDGVAVDTFTITTGEDQPETTTISLEAPVTATDVQLLVDGDIELYEWEPIVTATRPVGVTVYDSGVMDLGVSELVWFKALQIKLEGSGTLTITPYFDGVAADPMTAEITNSPMIVHVLSPRGYKGSTARVVITAEAPFYPYWIEFIRRTSGGPSQSKPIRVPLVLGGSAAA